MNEIKVIGVIGSGKMGFDLFNYLSDFNFKLVWYTRNEDHKEALKNTFHKKIKRQLKHGLISQENFDIRYNYRITNNFNDLSDCDLIIESIIEDAEIKLELFKSLDKIVKTSCILASNSSSILPSLLSQIEQKNRVLGLHFFYPIAFKNVVELITSEFTDEISIEKSRIFLQEIKRFFIEQDEKSAFILNRLLLELQLVAYNLLKEFDLGFKQLDEIAKQLVPEFGLFEVMDHVGHNTMYNAIRNYSRMEEDKKKYDPLLKELQSRRADSAQKRSHLFYDTEEEQHKISEKTEQEILSKLKETAMHYFKLFTDGYQLNPFNMKKALEEYCGIVL